MAVPAATPDLTWMISTDEELWHDGGPTRDAALALGWQENGQEGFWIAQGAFRGAWLKLFIDYRDLAEFIDNANEENSFEDGFCDEAAISVADLQDLTDKINAVWAEYVGRTKPEGRRIDLSNREWVPPGEAYRAALIAAFGLPQP